MNKLHIVPKRDWPNGGRGFYDCGRWVNKGWIVTDGFCNVMPAAAWFEDIPSACKAIAIYKRTGDTPAFWKEWYGR